MTALVRAYAYAHAVGTGEQPVCSFVRQAVARWHADLDRDDIRLRADEVERVCGFIETLPHVKGRWAAHRLTLTLEPWQCFVLANIFGLVRADGRRKYQEAYIEVPRKNGKSILMAAVGLYMVAADGEHGAEVYSLAGSEKQALEVFSPARAMLLRDDRLRAATGLSVRAKSIYRAADNSVFKPLIGDPPDGSSPSCAIIDEYHEHAHDRAHATMQTGMGAREQPLLVIITTAGDSLEGPCKAKRDEVADILRSPDPIDDHADGIFGIVYGVDAEKGENHWNTEAALREANPNYGVSVSGEWLLKQQQQAIRSVGAQGHFRTKHLDEWLGAANPWLNVSKWDDCIAPVSVETYDDRPCVIGLDLASRIDFTAAVVVFYEPLEDGLHYYAVPFFWLPRVRYDEVAEYARWGDFIAVTESDETDMSVVVGTLTTLLETLWVEEIAVDPWHSAGVEQQLQDVAMAEVVRVPQTVAHLTAPMLELQAAVEGGRLHVADNPVLTWMAGNLQGRRDTNDNVKPIRPPDKRKKIDGMVALIMAIGRCVALAGDDATAGMSEIVAV